jgi:riboflavin biosynthesis pyrimidine reductase
VQTSPATYRRSAITIKRVHEKLHVDADPEQAAGLGVAVREGPGQQAGAEVLRLPGTGRVSLRTLLGALSQRGLDSVLVEGGGQVHASALAEGVVHRVLGFVAPLMVGGQEARTPVEGPGVRTVDEGWRVQHLAWETVGPDLMCEGFLWDWSGLLR